MKQINNPMLSVFSLLTFYEGFALLNFFLQSRGIHKMDSLNDEDWEIVSLFKQQRYSTLYCKYCV